MAKKILTTAEVHQHLTDIATILHLAETLDEDALDYTMAQMAHIRRDTGRATAFLKAREIVVGKGKEPELELEKAWVKEEPATS